jgi:Domain of unknown function (DUF4214)/L,D-transpeptidase catalytic domain
VASDYRSARMDRALHRRSSARIAALAVFFAALTTIGVARPGAAAAAEACQLRTPTALRAALVPGATSVLDVAFNLDDPDADDAPLQPIRFPDEAAMWARSGVPTAAVVHGVQGGSVAAATATTAFAPSSVERTDREVSDSIVRLYCALMGRQPDSFELQYWAGRYWNGLPLVTIAEAFTESEEFIDRFGMPTDLGLVRLLYAEVLRRDAGDGGIRTYVDALDAGDLSRGSLIVSFTESTEYVAMTGTTRPEKPGLPYPKVGSGERVIYDNTNNRVYLIDETGELNKTHLVSGRRGIPSVGRYNVYSKSRYAYAPHDGITMEYMVRFARGEWPYGFHSIPVWPNKSPLQNSEELGTHRSGGCVRQEFDDAQYMFGWADVGTRVIVIRP